eukprot:PhF_6_TR9667/c0_g1_i3/m.14887/K15448/TRM112, TRMT112; multifunctional methyltransferase subunit TRM112
MKLLTHNFLQCVKCNGAGFPLQINITTPSDVTTVECEYEPDFIQNMLNRIDYAALQTAVETTRIPLPGPLPPSCDTGVLPPDQMQTLHCALNCIEIVNATLTCPACGQQYPVKERIPNMVVI